MCPGTKVTPVPASTRPAKFHVKVAEGTPLLPRPSTSGTFVWLMEKVAPIEQVVNGVEGMTYIQSSSTNSGVSTINVYFDIGRDPDLAAVDVQNRVNQVLGRLPADVRTTGVTVIKNTAGFLGGLGFFSKDNRYSAQFISNYLDLYVRDALKRVPGVGNVIIFGERKYAMRLWLDPVRGSATSSSTARSSCGSPARASPRSW